MLGQTLHGYEDGHVLIAGSVEPDDRAAELMLLMSDLAPVRPTDAHGWLTAYPLPTMDAFVLARTWPAPEMPRPGCVWTHSLILNYATLGALDSFNGLLEFFRRPTRGDFAIYRDVLPLRREPRPTRLARHLYPSAREGLIRLYDQNGPAVVPCPDGSAETVALSLWAQQWPRLRRRMRWATTPISPSSALPEFDFVMDSHHLPRLSSTDPLARHGWMVGAMADLRTGGGPIRTRLREYGIDVSQGRRAFSPLVAAALISQAPHPRARDAARLLSLIETRLPNEAASAKAQLLAAYMRASAAIEPELLDVALRLLPDLSADEAALRSIATACLKSAPDRFWDEVDLVFPKAADQALRDADPVLLYEELVRDVAHTDRILWIRPDLSVEPDVWSLSPTVREAALRLARSDKKTRKEGLRAALDRLDIEAALELTSEVGADAMLDVLAHALKRRNSVTRLATGEVEWIAAATRDLVGVRRYLEGSAGHNLIFIELARSLGPTSFETAPNTPDVWFEAWNNSKGPFDPANGEFIATFFLMRACRFEMAKRSVVFGVATNTVLEAVERGLTDPQAIKAVSDLSIPNYFNPFEGRYRALIRGLALWSAIQTVPIEGFVASGHSKHVEAFVGELRYALGGQEVIRRALKNGNSLPKRRRDVLETALYS